MAKFIDQYTPRKNYLPVNMIFLILVLQTAQVCIPVLQSLSNNNLNAITFIWKEQNEQAN